MSSPQGWKRAAGCLIAMALALLIVMYVAARVGGWLP
jgi:hypothetical protein